MRQWVELPPVDVPDEISALVGGHPLLAQTLVRRGLTHREAARAFLDPAFYRPSPASDFPDLPQAVERLAAAIQAGEQIWVWGDFDVDGQTATTVLVGTLRSLGANVNYHIPVRKYESHGVNLPELKKILEQGAGLILTCDTGISSHEALIFARDQGVEVIVTDHHDLPDELPPAYALVNPKRLPDSHPGRHLPGVGMAYRLAEALCACLGKPEVAETFLDLSALGIVADLATLTGDTRYLLQRGLARLRETPRLALKEMYALAEVNPTRLSEEHIGFILGPRLNAIGRLGDANPVVEFFLTQDITRARILAAELEGLNSQRRLLCEQVYQAAQAQIERDPSLLDGAALVLAHPTWPGGVIGIVASRLVEKYHRPTILIAAPEGEPGRGSARSLEGFNITAAIAAQKDLLLGFGGHPMAAGLAIDPENIPQFRRSIARTAAEMLGPVPKKPQLCIDGKVTLAELSLELVENLEGLAPFGPGNPALTLMTPGLELKGHTAVGRSGEHMQLIVQDEAGRLQKVIWWQADGASLPAGRFDLACTVRASDYRGQREVQVEWVEARIIQPERITLVEPRERVEIFDYRLETHPMVRLKEIQQKQETQVWREGEAAAVLPGESRLELEPGPQLIIWTIPPSNAELQKALLQVGASQVYLFAQDPNLDQLDLFLTRLAGIAKFSLARQAGQVELARLAAAMAHRVETVQKGLAWLQAKGYYQVESSSAGTVQLTPGRGNEEAESLRIAEAQLKAFLGETAAYRTYYRQAGKDALIGSLKSARTM